MADLSILTYRVRLTELTDCVLLEALLDSTVKCKGFMIAVPLPGEEWKFPAREP